MRDSRFHFKLQLRKNYKILKRIDQIHMFMSTEKWSTMQLKIGPLSDVHFEIATTSFF